MNILEPELNQEEPVDFDYFSNYSKLETLRINLEELFGTTNFITLYRVLEKELDEKGLEGFDIGDITNILPLSLDAKLVNQNLTLLLTLIAMESKMSAV